MPRLHLLAAVAALAIPVTASAGTVPPGVTAPVARPQVPAGVGTIVSMADREAGDREVDGESADWDGRLPGFGGTLLYSRGELVYEDHLFDAYGADSGQDAQRMAVQDPLAEAVPETYRADPGLQYVPEAFGIPTGPLAYATNYGDLAHQDAADLAELRFGTDDAKRLWVLARTTSMATDTGTALLLLLDTKPGSTERTVPYGSGLKTMRGDVAVFLAGDRGSWTDLATGETQALPSGSVATDSSGFENSIEARLPASLLKGEAFAVTAATGLANEAGTGLKPLAYAPNVANVAFRTSEPARDWWEKQQALELQKGSIDKFLVTADLGRMADGDNQRYVPGPGYHDRNFFSDPAISKENGRNGVRQHYGVYLPSGYDADRASPAQYWMHFRGGRAHIAAAVSPGIIHDMGEDAQSIVITPDGRGNDKWYMGKSQADFEEVWADSHKAFNIDRDRTYVAGHSMGGWASWLLPVLYPDRFAGTFPASGLPAWSGANTTQLLSNLREVPAVIWHGTEDELVPVTGAITQAKTLQELGYRYRLYLFPGQEHYGPPIVDQWSDGVRYEHANVRNPNPAQVTYTRSMPFERQVETYAADGVDFNFTFNRAYWMSGLEAADATNGVARFDGRSYAIPEVARTTFPEVGGPATADTTGPFTMNGQRWVEDTAKTSGPGRNAFSATLTGARAVALNLSRMRLDGHRTLTGEITTDTPLRLTLCGDLADRLTATIGSGTALDVDRAKGKAIIELPAGTHTLVVAPKR